MRRDEAPARAADARRRASRRRRWRWRQQRAQEVGDRQALARPQADHGLGRQRAVGDGAHDVGELRRGRARRSAVMSFVVEAIGRRASARRERRRRRSPARRGSRRAPGWPAGRPPAAAAARVDGGGRRRADRGEQGRPAEDARRGLRGRRSRRELEPLAGLQRLAVDALVEAHRACASGTPVRSAIADSVSPACTVYVRRWRRVRRGRRGRRGRDACSGGRRARARRHELVVAAPEGRPPRRRPRPRPRARSAPASGLGCARASSVDPGMAEEQRRIGRAARPERYASAHAAARSRSASARAASAGRAAAALVRGDDGARRGDEAAGAPRREGGREVLHAAALGADAREQEDGARHELAQARDVLGRGRADDRADVRQRVARPAPSSSTRRATRSHTGSPSRVGRSWTSAAPGFDVRTRTKTPARASRAALGQDAERVAPHVRVRREGVGAQALRRARTASASRRRAPARRRRRRRRCRRAWRRRGRAGRRRGHAASRPRSAAHPGAPRRSKQAAAA